MSDLSVSGGTGGIGANLDDMRRKAGALRGVGSFVSGRAVETARFAVDGDLLESAVLSPATAAAAELQIGNATAYLAVIATDTTVSAVFLDGAVTAYETADAALAAATTALRNGVMFVVGATIIPFALTVAAGAAAAGALYAAGTAAANAVEEAGDAIGQGLRTTATALQQNPWLAASPAALAGTLAGSVVTSYSVDDVVDGTARDLRASLDALAALAPGAGQALNEWGGRNGWVIDLVTNGSPGLLAGLSFWLGGGPVGGYLVDAGLSGRGGPPLTYDQMLESLIGGGGKFGLFDDGDLLTRAEVVPAPAMDEAPTQVNDLSGLFDGSSQIDAEDGGDEYARIRVIQVGTSTDAGGPHWIVQIPSTQGGLTDGVGGSNPNDLTSDVHAMLGQPTALSSAVKAAMANAGIGPRDPVMLEGFSLGGITAGLLASDPNLGYTVTHVVTGGSPISGFAVPGDVQVLAFEFTEDPVAASEGARNPDSANWTTVRGDAPLLPGETALPGIAGAHASDRYAQFAQQAVGAGNASIDHFTGSSSAFFDGPKIVTDYKAERT